MLRKWYVLTIGPTTTVRIQHYTLFGFITITCYTFLNPTYKMDEQAFFYNVKVFIRYERSVQLICSLAALVIPY